MKKAKTENRKRPGTGLDLNRLHVRELGAWHPPHVHQPCGTEEFEQMKSDDIYARIDRDIAELVARAYHQSVDRWRSEPPAEAQFEMRSEQAQLQKRIRADIARGLNSQHPAERERAERDSRELLEFDSWAARKAAGYLAVIGYDTAKWLEFLTAERLELLQPIARRFETWPVNLGLGKADANGLRCFQRAKVAEKNLRDLDLNAEAFWTDSENRAGQTTSPFRLAAERIYALLRVIRNEPLVWFVRHESFKEFSARRKPGVRTRLRSPIPKPNQLTQWARDLLNLQEPMTKANADDWWAAAKTLLDELLAKTPKAFAPLKEHLGLSDPAFTKSLVQRRVIDDSLKKAFKGLAGQ